jgi:hypothetical protein
MYEKSLPAAPLTAPAFQQISNEHTKPQQQVKTIKAARKGTGCSTRHAIINYSMGKTVTDVFISSFQGNHVLTKLLWSDMIFQHFIGILQLYFSTGAMIFIG